MLKVFKNYTYVCACTTSAFFFLQNIDVNATSEMTDCLESSSFLKCSDGKTHTFTSKSYQLNEQKGSSFSKAVSAEKSGTVINAENITITNSKTGVFAKEYGKVILQNSTIKEVAEGLSASENGAIKMVGGTINLNYYERSIGVSSWSSQGIELENVNITLREGKEQRANMGLYAGCSLNKMCNAKITMTNGSIDVVGTGAVIDKSSQGEISLTNVKITVKSGGSNEYPYDSLGMYIANNNSKLEMINGSIDFTNGVGVLVGEKGHADLDGVIITGKNNDDEGTTDDRGGLYLDTGGSIFLKDGRVSVSNTYGITMYQSVNRNMVGEKVDIENSTITAEKYPAIYITKQNSLMENFYAHEKISIVKLSKNSNISGDLLLKAKGGIIEIQADQSTLKGGVSIANGALVNFSLKNNSTWTLTTRKNNNFTDQRHLNNIAWFITSLELNHSIVQFDPPKNFVYQTLNVGKGSGVVYNAVNDAKLYLNVFISKENNINDQKTDRLLIHGNVSGTTTVYITGQNGSSKDDIGRNGNTQGISLIQVSGTAQEHSFKLEGDYITIDGSPYQYVLSAYGPGSSRGQASLDQKLVSGNGSNFWDYRLQSKYISPRVQPSPPKPAPVPPESLPPVPEPPTPSKPQDPRTPDLPGKRIPAVVPQLPSYLLLPHALFHTGLVDVSNQHELLEIIQNASHEPDKNRKTSFFIRGYGSNHHYTSNLSVFEHGYGADLDYNNVTIGIVLNTLESKHSASSFGVMGSYGQLSLQPRAVKQSQKSVFNKWSGKLYANLHHDTGVYANGFISYDFFKGDVVTLSRGKTAELKGGLLNASLIGGHAIITGYNGLIIEPQLQVIYQSLMFDQARDIDRFDIDLGSHDQLIGRIGGCLTKVVSASEKAHVVSFYTKLHAAHSYEKKRIVHFKDAFQLGAFGSTVETGMGVHAQLSNTITFHGDLLYQHKLTKAGFSGISVSGGLRYQF
ncbi:outer membrane autotransporter barrel domain-containing protein [Bartonella sp. CDC_skunk]|uniref:autotransporter outer membrane beta-barrel domain-containing protein n=1 Tax=unclassified Bartonella TaxID=2645622 RepID=UPI00099A9E7C|nr:MULTISPECIES: autotransporter outer membrane beta-barrel domain-containing protein [unclassified Bartonella]AQX20786.1 outer membrane autotransporter barrel domain-containing protein [Bartonella sp. CDC_skunk]AQX26040.1 outer membrane autotransporter barrel domain-containing protein [Bartonella sp. Raccoon60]